MSDISIKIGWVDLILLSPYYGWPGLLGGAILGALIWPKRRALGALICGLVGNSAVFSLRVFG